MVVTSSATSVSIVTQQGRPKLSKGQKTFNALIKQIESSRELLRSWEQANTSFQKEYVEEFLPLVQRFSELQQQMVRSLDQAWSQTMLTKPEKRLISELVTGLLGLCSLTRPPSKPI